MTKHVEMPESQLRGFERLAVPLVEQLNRSHALRQATHLVQRLPVGAVIHGVVNNLVEPHGLEELAKAHIPSGLLIVSNHRSFFDFYFLATWITFHTRHCKELQFPVRSDFFYTNPLGLAVNLLVAGGAMWPPVFRDDRRRTLNPIGVEQVARAFGPGVVTGIHPEGKRSKLADCYSFLPLRPGLGQLLEFVDPEVRIVPAYVAGTSSSVLREAGRNFKPAGRRGEPIRLWYGAVRSVGSILAEASDAQLRTDLAFAGVRELAERDRARYGSVGR